MKPSKTKVADNPLLPFSGASGVQREMSFQHPPPGINSGKWHKVESFLALHFSLAGASHQEADLIPPTQRQQSGINWCLPFARKMSVRIRGKLNLHPISLHQDSMIQCFIFARMVVCRANKKRKIHTFPSPCTTPQQGDCLLLKKGGGQELL